MRAKIKNLVTCGPKFLDHTFIERIAAVVSSDCNSHNSEQRPRVLQNILDIEAQLEADKTFQQLLGKDASQRYEVIMSEANLVEDLDI